MDIILFKWCREAPFNRKEQIICRILYVFIVFSYIFILLIPCISAQDSLEVVLQAIALNEQLLTNGRLEISCNADQKLAGEIFCAHFVWIFKDDQWRIEHTSKRNETISSSIQVFDGERRFIFTKAKFAESGNTLQRGEISNERVFKEILPGSYSPHQYITNLLEFQSVGSVLNKAKSVRLAGWQKVDGVDCHLIRFRYSYEIEGAVWIDPARGYRFRRAVCSMAGGYIVRRVTNFKKTSGGVWLPARGDYTVYGQMFGKLRPNVRAEFTLDKADLGTQIDASEFLIEFPPGTKVHNLITNTVEGISKEEIITEEELFRIAVKAKNGQYNQQTLPSNQEN